MRPRVGIVGISGYYAFSFAEALWTNHEVDFVAASTWPEEEKGTAGGGTSGRGAPVRQMSLGDYEDKFEVKMHDDPLAMIKQESLDGVCLCGNTDDHRDMVDELAPSGTHLFFHKPMCNTIEEADHILAAIGKHGNKTGACNPARYDDAIRAAKALIDAGELGDVLSARAFLSHSGTPKARLPKGAPPLRGPEMHLGFYNADLTQWFMGWPAMESAYAHYAKLNAEDAQPDDSAKGLVKFKDGRMASMDLYCSPFWQGPLWEIEAIGTKGFVRTSQSVNQGALFTAQGVKAFQHDHQHARRVHANELGAWAQAVAKGEDCELSAKLAHSVIELCVAWKRSSDLGKPVTFPIERGV